MPQGIIWGPHPTVLLQACWLDSNLKLLRIEGSVTLIRLFPAAQAASFLLDLPKLPSDISLTKTLGP